MNWPSGIIANDLAVYAAFWPIFRREKQLAFFERRGGLSKADFLLPCIAREPQAGETGKENIKSTLEQKTCFLKKWKQPALPSKQQIMDSSPFHALFAISHLLLQRSVWGKMQLSFCFCFESAVAFFRFLLLHLTSEMVRNESTWVIEIKL